MRAVACQAPLSPGFSRREHWTGLPCPPPGDLPDPGTEPRLLHGRRILYCLATSQPSGFLTRDQTQAPCNGRVEPQPLGHQGSPVPLAFLPASVLKAVSYSMFAVSLLGTWPPSGVSEAELSVAVSSPCIVFDPCFRNLSGQCALMLSWWSSSWMSSDTAFLLIFGMEWEEGRRNEDPSFSVDKKLVIL